MTATAGVGTTHLHLLAVLAASLEKESAVVRILDAGCGSGALLGLLHRELSATRADLSGVEVYGFDILDQRLHVTDPLQAALLHLQSVDGSVDWTPRLSAVDPREPWPYPDAFFDSVVSNQVLEHVADLEHFFSEIARVLRPGGQSHHLFPLRDYIWEGHLLLPFVHRVRSHEVRKRYIAALSRAGLGKYRGDDLEVFSERHADYIHHLTTYRSWPQLADAAARAGLRIDYGWTLPYYLQKWRRMRGRNPQQRYDGRPTPVAQVAAFHVLKHVAGVTVTLTREQTYLK